MDDISYEYPIYDQNNQEIENPDLTLGHLEKEIITTYHNAIPEKGHYYVSYIELNTGESFFLQEDDPRIEIINQNTGAFKYLPSEENSSIQVKGASVRYVIDQPKIDAYTTEKVIYRYILYTAEELENNIFLKEGPGRLEILESDTEDLFTVVADLAGSDIEDRVAENQETLDDLVLLVADLLGGAEEI